MIPKHCREVGVKRVSFELTEDAIKSNFLDKKLYTATNYLILHNGDRYAVCVIKKEDGFELFRKVVDIDVIGLPEDTVYVEDPEINVLNPSKLVGKAEEATGSTGAKVVVVKGTFDHISFSFNENRNELVVLETVPPNPPKLVRLAENVVNEGQLTHPVKLKTEFIKVDELAGDTEAGSLVFPCRTSGLTVEGKKIFYLDELPELSEMTDSVLLVGCSLSDRIFKSHYHRKPEFVNMCPSDMASRMSAELNGTPVLLKCCKLKDDYEIDGNLIKVPWGTTTRIIENAINEYFSRIDEINGEDNV